MEMEKLIELRVSLRDLITDTVVATYDQIRWVDQHAAHVSAALEQWVKTLGGTIMITGTPEVGRVTIYQTSTDTTPVVDFDWFTKTH